MKIHDNPLQNRFRAFLETLHCCNCKKKDLFGELACLAIDKNRPDFFLSWCKHCQYKGIRLIDSQDLQHKKKKEKDESDDW